MSKKLSDLNTILFDQLERLNNPDLDEKTLKKETERAKAITDVSRQVIDAHQVHLDAVKLIAEHKGLGGHEPAVISESLRIN